MNYKNYKNCYHKIIKNYHKIDQKKSSKSDHNCFKEFQEVVKSVKNDKKSPNHIVFRRLFNFWR